MFRAWPSSAACASTLDVAASQKRISGDFVSFSAM